MNSKTGFKQTEIGEIPDEWEVREIEQISNRVCVGYVGSCFKDYCSEKEGVPLLRTTNLSDRGIIFEDLKYVTKEFHEKNKKSQVQKGDLLIARHGENGQACIYEIDSEANCLNVVLIKPNHEVSSKYILYCLKSPILKHQIKASLVGSVQGVLNTKIIAKLKIPYPSEKERNLITKILSDLDSKIQLNQQMNKILEAIGQALFKHWFIDFEFPNEKGKPYKSSGGKMVHSDEVGKEIPKNWNTETLENFVDVTKGCSYKSSDLKDSDTALVNLKCINRGGGFNVKGLKPYVGQYKGDQVIHYGEIVVSHTDLTQKAEVLGRPAVVRDVSSFQTLVASLDLCIVRPKDEILNIPFIYYLLKTYDFHNHAFGYANGTTVLHLSKKAIPEYTFILPEKKIVKRFGIFIEKLLNKIHRNESESEILSTVRDALLPKLMSGKIRVNVSEIGNKERMEEAVT